MGFSCTLWKDIAFAQKAGEQKPHFRFSEMFNFLREEIASRKSGEMSPCLNLIIKETIFHRWYSGGCFFVISAILTKPCFVGRLPALDLFSFGSPDPAG